MLFTEEERFEVPKPKAGFYFKTARLTSGLDGSTEMLLLLRDYQSRD